MLNFEYPRVQQWTTAPDELLAAFLDYPLTESQVRDMLLGIFDDWQVSRPDLRWSPGTRDWCSWEGWIRIGYPSGHSVIHEAAHWLGHQVWGSTGHDRDFVDVLDYLARRFYPVKGE
jgi:hypothetical protein